MAIQKPVRTKLVEAINPAAQRLSIHLADPGCVSLVHAIQDRRKPQQVPALVAVPGALGQTPRIDRRNIALPWQGCRLGANFLATKESELSSRGA